MIGLRAEDLPDFQKNSISFEKTDKKQMLNFQNGKKTLTFPGGGGYTDISIILITGEICNEKA